MSLFKYTLFAATILTLSLNFSGDTYAQAAQNEGATPYNPYYNPYGPYGLQEEEEEKPTVFNPYDKKYRPAAYENNDKTGLGALLPNYRFIGTFLRIPEADPDEITMRFFHLGAVTGCIKQKEGKGQAEVLYRGTTAYINLESNSFEIDTETPYYSLYSCRVTNNSTEVDIKLSKQQLKKNNIKKISFSRPDLGNTRGIDIEIHPTHFVMENNNRNSKSASKRSTYWLFPANTLILTHPDLKYTAEDLAILENFAKSKGLTPLKEIYTDFDLDRYPHKAVLYVVDEEGAFTSKQEENPNGFIIGSIQTPEIFYGPEGKTERMTPSPVRAHTPGLYE